MTIKGIGSDIEEVKRFRKLPYGSNPAFYKKIFTEQEIKYCLAKSDSHQHFAGKFAAKEAVSKALNQSVYKAKSIEILNDQDGAPTVKVKSPKSKVKIIVSISHTKDYAIAVVLSVDGKR